MDDVKGKTGEATTKANMKQCSACGKKLDPAAAFCTGCGRRLEAMEPQGPGAVPLEAQILALANEFLSVKETAPARFEFSSETGAHAPVQKVMMKYTAVAQLEPEKKLLTFWEKMVESSAGANAGFFSEKKVQKGVEVGREIHGHLLSGGKYGFEYGKLRDVVKTITVAEGWKFKTVAFKPAVDKFLPSKQDHEKMRLNRCVQCGASLLQGVAFCTKCGAPVESKKDASDHKASKKRRWIPLTLAGIGLLVALTMLVFMLTKGDKETIISEKADVIALENEGKEKAGDIEEIGKTVPVPENTDAVYLNNEGMKMAKAGRVEEAASLFKKAVQANPDNFNAWNNLGLAFRKIGKNEEAVKAYRRAIGVKPEFAVPYKNLGIVLEQMNNDKEAAEAYNKYYELNPSASDAQAVKEKADRLMNTKHGGETER